MASHDLELESGSEKTGVQTPDHVHDAKNPPASESEEGDRPAVPVVDFPEGGLRAWSVVFGV